LTTRRAMLALVALVACLLVGLTEVPSAAAAGDAERGKELFLRYCAGCHGPDGRGGGHTFMPHINNLTKKGYIDLLPDDHLRLVITKGGQAVGKSSYMPAWEGTLSEQDIEDIIAHIRSLPTY
jgi:mono/diheme cytochrome c family protein